MTESELIDKILSDYAEGRDLGLMDKDTFAIFGGTIKKMRAFKLLESSGNIYLITQIGHEVIEAGGFDKWKDATKKREDEAHKATLDSAKATVDAAQSAKKSYMMALGSTVLTAVSLILVLIQYWESQRKSITLTTQEPTPLTQSVPLQKSSPREKTVLVDSFPKIPVGKK